MTKYTLTLLAFFINASFAETGYIEGDYRYINAPQSGWLTHNVRQGQTLKKGTRLLSLDDDNQQLAVKRAKAMIIQAQAQLDQARANSQNLQTGQRVENLNVLKKQRTELKARLKLAGKTLKRYQKLKRSKAISAIEIDQARANVDILNAQIQKIDAELTAKNLPARADVIASAESGAGQANAMLASAQITLKQAQKKLNERQIHSRLTGTITQVYRFEGEYIGAGTPIAQVLADSDRKAIFFVHQDKLTSLKLGGNVIITGDGNVWAKGTIHHIADRAEYTPPIIYTEKSRGDLVFRVEATLDKALPIGLPVEVAL